MNRPAGRWLLGSVIALAALLAWQVSLFREYLRSLERDVPSVERADAIVSLAGASGRLDRGLELLLEGKADVLLLSGTGKGATIEDIFPGRDLTALGSRVILLENRSTSTYENAIEAWAVLTSRSDVDEIILLTSDYHLLRSEFVFRKVFPPGVRIHAWPVDAANVERGRWWRDARSRKLVVTEYLKYVWYRVRY